MSLIMMFLEWHCSREHKRRTLELFHTASSAGKQAIHPWSSAERRSVARISRAPQRHRCIPWPMLQPSARQSSCAPALLPCCLHQSHLRHCAHHISNDASCRSFAIRALLRPARSRQWRLSQWHWATVGREVRHTAARATGCLGAPQPSLHFRLARCRWGRAGEQHARCLGPGAQPILPTSGNQSALAGHPALPPKPRTAPTAARPSAAPEPAAPRHPSQRRRGSSTR